MSTEFIAGIDGKDKLTPNELKSLQELSKLDNTQLKDKIGEDKINDFKSILESEKDAYLQRVTGEYKYGNDWTEEQASKYVPSLIDSIIDKLGVEEVVEKKPKIVVEEIPKPKPVKESTETNDIKSLEEVKEMYEGKGDEVSNFLDDVFGNKLTNSLSIFNEKEFSSIDKKDGFSEYELEQFKSKIDKAIDRIGLLKSYNEFKEAHKNATDYSLGWSNKDKFLAKRLDMNNFYIPGSGNINVSNKIFDYVNEKIGDGVEISEEELKEMRDKEFDIKSIDSMKDFFVVLGVEIGEGLQDIIKMILNIGAGVALTPRYIMNKNKIEGRVDTDEEARLIIENERMLEENPSLAIIELVANGAEILEQIWELMKSGTNEAVALGITSIVGLLAGGAGVVKLLGKGAKAAGKDTKIGKFGEKLELSAGKVADKLDSIDNIITTGGLNKLIPNSKIDIASLNKLEGEIYKSKDTGTLYIKTNDGKIYNGKTGKEELTISEDYLNTKFDNLGNGRIKLDLTGKIDGNNMIFEKKEPANNISYSNLTSDINKITEGLDTGLKQIFNEKIIKPFENLKNFKEVPKQLLNDLLKNIDDFIVLLKNKGEKLNSSVLTKLENIKDFIKNKIDLHKANSFNKKLDNAEIGDIIKIKTENSQYSFLKTDNGNYKMIEGSDLGILNSSINKPGKLIILDHGRFYFQGSDTVSSKVIGLEKTSKLEKFTDSQMLRSKGFKNGDQVVITYNNGIKDNGEILQLPSGEIELMTKSNSGTLRGIRGGLENIKDYKKINNLLKPDDFFELTRGKEKLLNLRDGDSFVLKIGEESYLKVSQSGDKLKIITSNGKITELSPNSKPLEIGRSLFNLDTTVSKNHLKIEYTDEGIKVIDTSTNGTKRVDGNDFSINKPKNNIDFINDFEKIPKSEHAKELLSKYPNLKPIDSFEIDGQKFLLSGVFNGIREEVVGFININGVLESRLFYKSNSDGGWRATPGQRIDDGYSKGEDIPGHSYTVTTKIDDKMGNKLDELKLVGRGDIIEEFYELFRERKFPLYDDKIINETIKYDDKGKLVSYKKGEPGNWYDDRTGDGDFAKNTPEEIKEYIRSLDNSFDNGFIPDFFKGPIKTEIVDHTIAGKTKVEIFEGTLNGKKIEWHMSQVLDNPNQIWISNIRLSDTKINSFGIDSEFINSGILTNKPFEYDSQLPPSFAGTREKIMGQYYDITDILGELKPIREYKNYLDSKEKLAA